jgi:hypothetical protein
MLVGFGGLVMDFTRSGRIHIQSFCYRRSMDQRERITQSIQKLINSHAQHSNTAQTTTQPKLITKNSTFCSYVTRSLARSLPLKAKRGQARLPLPYSYNHQPSTNQLKTKGNATLSIPSKTPLALCYAAVSTRRRKRKKIVEKETEVNLLVQLFRNILERRSFSLSLSLCARSALIYLCA